MRSLPVSIKKTLKHVANNPVNIETNIDIARTSWPNPPKN